MRKSIILKNDTFQKLPAIRLEFPYDFELKETVKGFPECNWHLKERARAVPYTQTQVSELLQYLKAYDPKKYLIEGRGGGKYSERSLAEVLSDAVEKAGIKKPVTPHWLRHSYATHLHEGGTDIRYIQELLGHQSSRTTEIYTHVSNRKIKEIRSPIEDMDIKI